MWQLIKGVVLVLPASIVRAVHQSFGNSPEWSDGAYNFAGVGLFIVTFTRLGVIFGH